MVIGLVLTNSEKNTKQYQPKRILSIVLFKELVENYIITHLIGYFKNAKNMRLCHNSS